MELFSGLVGYIVAGCGAILAAIAVWFGAKQVGRKESDLANAIAEDKRTSEENNAVLQKQNETLKETSDAKTSVIVMPDGSAASELRKQWQRD